MENYKYQDTEQGLELVLIDETALDALMVAGEIVQKTTWPPWAIYEATTLEK